MSKVKKLSDDLANKIAAGEVVERPASVVKELVENAIDAGATRVRVDIVSGGLSKIIVTDDGDGMSQEDALLALERHATSKIRVFDDLLQLTSFGFRGEALPSIASVSKLTLITRTRKQNEGTRVSIEGGKAVVARPAGTAPGTIVEVADLFFNVPARRKFLKSTATESAHVGEAVLCAALARPEATFELHRDGKLARTYLRAKDRGERARDAITGDDLVTIEATRGDTRIEAFLGRPEKARAGAASLHLVVNGRVVKDRALARAIAQAYGSVLEPGRYPLGVFYIDIPPELVDVNVHPQKAEVRFAAGRALFDLVARELNTRLASALSLPPTGVFSPWRAHAKIATAWQAPVVPKTTQKSAGLEDARNAALGLVFTAPASSPDPPNTEPDASAAIALTDTQHDHSNFYGSLRFLGQVNGTYLICEADDGLIILDQHAAAERVTFDRLRRQFREREVATQKLLVPEILQVNAEEAELVEARADEIAEVGVELARVGPTTVSVIAVPQILKSAPERIARDVIAEMGQREAYVFSGAVDLVLATMACHGSIRAGDVVAKEEALALLKSLADVDFSGHCPHGRPIVTTLSWAELGRRVGR